MKSLFEQNGGTYSVVGDYFLPDLTLHPKSNLLSASMGCCVKPILKRKEKHCTAK